MRAPRTGGHRDAAAMAKAGEGQATPTERNDLGKGERGRDPGPDRGFLLTPEMN